jgi:hypothetical protein
MNKTEARELLERELANYKNRSPGELSRLVDRTETFERRSPSGTVYQIEVQVFWDDKPNQGIRVVGSIDDGGWRALAPMSDDFIVLPDGSFIGK